MGNEKIRMDTYTDDLLCLLDKLGLTKVNLIGLSLGGAIALDFTVKHPDRVSSLVLMSSFHRCDRHLTNTFKSLQKSLHAGFSEFYDMILPMVLCPKLIAEYEDELNMIKESASKTANIDAYIEAIDACLNFNVEGKLAKIDTPTLILSGRYDEITLLDLQKELNDKLKNSKMYVFDDAKHNILVGKNIEKITAIVKKFIDDKCVN